MLISNFYSRISGLFKDIQSDRILIRLSMLFSAQPQRYFKIQLAVAVFLITTLFCKVVAQNCGLKAGVSATSQMVCAGADIDFIFSGTANAAVTYRLVNGATVTTTTKTLDNTGAGTVTVTAATVTSKQL